MHPSAISKNYGVAGTLFNFGRQLTSLNCLLIFTLLKSNYYDSFGITLRFLQSLSRMFN